MECGMSECGHENISNEEALANTSCCGRWNKVGKIPSLLKLIGGTLQSSV